MIVVQFWTSGTEFCVSRDFSDKLLSAPVATTIMSLSSIWTFLQTYKVSHLWHESRSQFAGHSDALTLRCTILHFFLMCAPCRTLNNTYCVSYKTKLGHLPKSQTWPQWRAKPTVASWSYCKRCFSLQSMPTYLRCSTPKSNAVQEEGLTNKGRHYLLLLCKQTCDKRGIA